jgi:type I restriction enzyme R subunit
MFEFFDPNEAYRVSMGSLPHWFQPGVTYFMTFRTDDSIPPKVAVEWRQRQRDWLCSHGIDQDRPDWEQSLRTLSDVAYDTFHRTFSREFLAYLDRGYGQCVLRRPEMARIVAESLHHFDGKRYQLGDYVIMPNHVHLLMCLLGDTDIELQCYSWKKFTAGKINQVLDRAGRFWQEESFDHLVRTPEDFERFQQYIAENGPKAGLREGEYLHWRRPAAT